MYTLKNDIPAVSRNKYPFRDMAIGQSFEFPASVFYKVKSAANQYGRRNGMKFSVRRTDTGGCCWRIA